MKGELKLKREVAAKSAVKPLPNSKAALVWVDASVYHLDQRFTYLVPGNLEELVEVGSLVSVPFHGREITGVVIDRVDEEIQQGLKSISKVIGSIPLLTPQIIDLISLAAQRYAAHPFDLIRSAIPDRSAAVEREFGGVPRSDSPLARNETRQFLQLPPTQNRSALLARKIVDLASNGGVIALMPDTGELAKLAIELEKLTVSFTVLDSHLPKSENFRNFLKIRTGEISIVIGTRSAVFAPVAKLTSILIYNDGSENFYERRAPGWNVRDISLLRSRKEHVDLYFAGYSQSSEVARFIDEDWCQLKRSRAKLKVLVHPQIHGELIPSRSVPIVKTSLKTGPVLVLVPQKGYAQAIRCSKCRTISRCDCGGALEKKSERSPITCSHCLTQFPQWSCSWCHGNQPALVGRGIERHQQEIGALFPGTAIQISTQDHPITGAVTSGIVIATPGMAPNTIDGYSAVVVVEGNRFLNQPDQRADERVREMYFAHAALAQEGAPIILIQDEGHAIASALTSWNPSLAISRDLAERRELGLPPYVRTAALTMEVSEIAKMKSALIAAKDEGRIPQSAKILGPISTGEKSTLIITADISESDDLVRTIHEFMRRRSAAKKPLPALRIDPYSLSH